MESNKDYEVKKFLLEQMEGESDDAHLERVKSIQEYWDSFHDNEPLAS